VNRSCGSTLALPDEMERWSLTMLREKVVKIGAKVVVRARSTVFRMAEVAVLRDLFGRILEMIEEQGTALLLGARELRYFASHSGRIGHPSGKCWLMRGRAGRHGLSDAHRRTS
jgi:hypothetical protein